MKHLIIIPGLIILMAVLACETNQVDPVNQLSDEELILAIQQSTDKATVLLSEIPTTAEANIMEDYPERFVANAWLASDLGYEVNVRPEEVKEMGDGEMIYFAVSGRPLARSSRRRDSSRIDSTRACFSIVYPISYEMPDSTIVTGTSRTDLNSVLRTWYAANPNAQGNPRLIYPVDATVYGLMVTANNEQELRRYTNLCDTTGTRNYDCPNLNQNIGDSCRTGAGVVGVVDRTCTCNTATYDCPRIFANIGDTCRTANGVGVVDVNCNCN